MMKWVWSGMVLLSVVVGLATGRIGAVSQAAIKGAQDAVLLCVTLLGVICLWNGLMKIAESAGVTRVLARLFLPLTRRLFPDLPPRGEGMQAVCMNMTANLLGLGNAATPLGLRAMREMAAVAPRKGTASNSMAMFVVINTAALQLIPTTTAAIRIRFGSANPFDILPCTWISALVSLAVGIGFAYALGGKEKRHG
ncbi:nucleoside recognition domain-containing protein [Ethanoligenens harbinense]|uniref:Nucleoside recognition domain protein n=1 Tax=Ethanoligenens harbinense (strain DSM 18485 / JCM 12961 / CGMCC 1.5033 / YUAN-3) TaxID=663278 RepID=E6U868_ETHHY|nr:nucleoside recognition domain-containing protein [Ethanoligenens harbinense]ADU27087.1 nucleoside recognition domain protein [Ethanoligenens harbinense YUAN-3]AVQ96165.1 spore maturation protein A [Ethanoligenens harbinense YUAN-3]AYF38825.1 spore maturation protein A [Ethanoligenens harbinense]AYF41575.1 spore maturation protein A [Ethanoligenens harbinense]QCN92406.1 spore maturation protein A [Ethanoligenens harbinense]